MRAVVLAGGLGSRLRARVPNLPKPMAPVAGRPFLAYVLDNLIAGGVTNLVLSVGYRAEVVQEYFGPIYREATVRYALEPEPLGTGGAIAFASREFPDVPWLVVNGDTFLDIDYKRLIDWYEQSPCWVAMVLRSVEDVSRYGAVQTNGDRVTGFTEKGLSGMGTVNAGVYILQPEVFGRLGLSGKFSLETDFLQANCEYLKPRAFLSEGYFIDIGLPEDYDRAQETFSHRR